MLSSLTQTGPFRANWRRKHREYALFHFFIRFFLLLGEFASQRQSENISLAQLTHSSTCVRFSFVWGNSLAHTFTFVCSSRLLFLVLVFFLFWRKRTAPRATSTCAYVLSLSAHLIELAGVYGSYNQLVSTTTTTNKQTLAVNWELAIISSRFLPLFTRDSPGGWYSQENRV